MSATYTYTTAQLAERLQTHPHTIRGFRSGLRSPELLCGLPEPIQKQPHLIWLVADIEAWLDSRRTFRPDAQPTPAPTPRPATKRGPGRPRKEQADPAPVDAAMSEGGEQ